jgi:hypothetical protein
MISRGSAGLQSDLEGQLASLEIDEDRGGVRRDRFDPADAQSGPEPAAQLAGQRHQMLRCPLGKELAANTLSGCVWPLISATRPAPRCLRASEAWGVLDLGGSNRSLGNWCLGSGAAAAQDERQRRQDCNGRGDRQAFMNILL